VSPSRQPESWTPGASRAPTPSGKTPAATDAGKKINGRKRFIITDTAGLLITVAVLAASWQDRDGGKTALLACT
jgi:hypothetical protein